MSYTVNKRYESASYSHETKGRSYSIPYIVNSTTPYDKNIHAARSASGMPAIGSVYEHDSGSFCKRMSLNEVSYGSSETVFYFTADYEPSDGSLNYNSSSPLTEPPKISFATAKYQEPFERAYNDTYQGEPATPVLNSAGIQFDPPAIKERINTIINIQYNKKTFNGSWIQQYTGTINRDSLTVAGISIPGQCGRINEIGASNNYDENGAEYWTISISIEVSNTFMYRKILDQGMMALGSNGTPEPIYVLTDTESKQSELKLKSDIAADILLGQNSTKTAEPVSEPQKLDGSGGILAAGEEPEYIEFWDNKAISWSTLSIPKTTSSSS